MLYFQNLKRSHLPLRETQVLEPAPDSVNVHTLLCTGSETAHEDPGRDGVRMSLGCGRPQPDQGPGRLLARPGAPVHADLSLFSHFLLGELQLIQQIFASCSSF